MSKALEQGLGTGADLVAAYAWLKLFSETSPGIIAGRVEMNELALKMGTPDLQRAQDLAAQMKAGNWQPQVSLIIPEGDSRLKLNGLTIGAKTSFAIINGETLSAGESTTVRLKTGTMVFKCLKIEKDSVSIFIDGEAQPRILRLAH